MSHAGLRRELGAFDLTLLLIVAVVNINILPKIAESGWAALSFWALAFVLFVIPQAMAVTFFARRSPGEGGIYIWTRESFGDFHGFLSGWCYWTNNLFYYPSVLFILTGVLVYAGGADAAGLAEKSKFIAVVSLSFLWGITLLHVRGLNFGKWLNNAGAIGTWITFAILIVIALLIYGSIGEPATSFQPAYLVPSLFEYRGLAVFSVVLYSLVGLELGSVMGDEIKNTAIIIKKAVFLGATISILLYVLGTICLLFAVPASEVGAIQGLMQAVTEVASNLQMAFVIPVVAILMSIAVLGICSAWMSGAARIPFVMGLDVYLPAVLGRTHSKWKTPYIALLVQAVLSTFFILLSLFGSSVRDAYEKLLSSSVAIQLIPFLYLFAAYWKAGARVPAAAGLVSTAAAVILVFVPSPEVESVPRFLIEVIGSFIFMIGVAGFLYQIGKRKQHPISL